MNDNKILLTKKTTSSLARDSFKHLNVKDPRVKKRAISISKRISQNPETSFIKLFPKESEKEAAYRFIENKKITASSLCESIAESSFETLRTEKPERIIVPNDTTTQSQNPKVKNVEGMGPIGTLTSNGFFIHTALWLDIDGTPRGILNTYFMTRKRKKVGKNHYKYAKIKDKESYKWFQAVENIEAKIPDGIKITYVSDRESDIHEYFELMNKYNRDYVIRCSYSRRTSNPDGESKIAEELDKENIKAIIKTQLPCKGKNKTVVKDITLHLTWKKVRIQPRAGGPKIHKNRKPFYTYCMRVQGKFDTGKEIKWILYTNIPVVTLADALETLRIYKARWRIEEYHLVLKSGLGIEKVKFRHADNIKRFFALCIPTAIKLLEVRYCNSYKPQENVTCLLSPIYVKALKMLLKQQGKKIPRKITIKIMVETIGVAGGWMARKRDGPPGVRTLWCGWKRLEAFVQALEILQS